MDKIGIGKQAIMDIYDCKIQKIEDIKYIKDLLFKSAKSANLHIVGYKFHKFKPIGISGVLILAESHLTIHTWPEYNYMAIDVFTCGTHIEPTYVCKIIAESVNSKKYKIECFERGNECEISRIRSEIIRSK